MKRLANDLLSRSQALSQILCPCQLSFREDFTSSCKVVSSIEQKCSHDDLVRHGFLVVVDVACACWTEETADILACETFGQRFAEETKTFRKSHHSLPCTYIRSATLS